jgi:hypothetical protein
MSIIFFLVFCIIINFENILIIFYQKCSYILITEILKSEFSDAFSEITLQLCKIYFIQLICIINYIWKNKKK